MSGMNPDAMAALAADLLPRVAQGFAESPVFVGAMATRIDRLLSQKFEEHMSTAGDKAESAFKLLAECISKSTEIAIDALRRLERGSNKISPQHNDM